MSKEIRIVIADDHPIFRQGLRMIIESDSLLRVVAEADNGESALAHILELQPDVAVLDINMPAPDGLANSVSPARTPFSPSPLCTKPIFSHKKAHKAQKKYGSLQCLLCLCAFCG